MGVWGYGGNARLQPAPTLPHSHTPIPHTKDRQMTTSITFHGATDTVTGSRHLLETAGKRVLVDCGLFQGPREIRERNWKPFPVPAESIDAVVLTHAHMDHTGYLPRLVKQGFRGPVYCTAATR